MLRRVLVIVTAVALLVIVRPALAQAPSPDVRAAAKELVETMRMADQFKVIVPMMLQQFKSSIVQGRADVERDYDALAPRMLPLFDARMEEIIAGIAAVYATHFTADELRQMAAFYRTPVGQKLLQVLPKVTQDVMTVGGKIGEQVGAEANRRMIEELRKKGHKI